MIVRLLTGVGALLLFLGGAAFAQSPADVHFHEAAQHYIADDLSAARQAVKRGLEAAPSDPRLQSLQKKLKQAANTRRGTSSQNQETSGSQGEQSGRSGSSGSSERGATQRDAPTAGSSEQSRTSSRRPEPSSPSERSSEAAGDRNTDGQNTGPGSEGTSALSRAQAERLLQALEGQEKRLLRELQARSSEKQKVEKDW